MNELAHTQGLRELALFAGAGGGILGGHLLGWRTVCAVEWADYPRRVLLARQRDGILPRFPIWDDVQTFDGNPWRGRVDVVSGGFPCQDISAAGKGAGIDGARSGMWFHMARIVREVRSRFVFVENSPMLTSRGLGRVLGDLAAMGYDAEWGVLGADDCGAPPMSEAGSGLLPTPLASIATHGGPNQRDSSGRPGLQMAAMMWPTPSSHKQTASGDLVNRDGTTWDGVSKPHSKATGKPVQTALLDKIKYSTPTVNDAKNSSLPPSQINRDSLVGDVMRNWPAPRTKWVCGGSGALEQLKQATTPEEARVIRAGDGGQLNPPWVEWLMGWPIEWTALKPLEMVKFLQWQQQHSGF